MTSAAMVCPSWCALAQADDREAHDMFHASRGWKAAPKVWVEVREELHSMVGTVHVDDGDANDLLVLSPSHARSLAAALTAAADTLEGPYGYR